MVKIYILHNQKLGYNRIIKQTTKREVAAMYVILSYKYFVMFLYMLLLSKRIMGNNRNITEK